MDQPRILNPWIACGDTLKNRSDQRYIGEIGDREQPGAQTVVDVVVVIGDVVGQRCNLRLGARELVEGERVAAVIFGDRWRQRSVDARAAQGTIVLGDALERFPASG